MKFSPSIFRANDIRGLYKKDFHKNFAVLLGKGLSEMLFSRCPQPKVLIAHDSRLSSPELAKSLSQSLKRQGVDTAFVGIAPSPLCYFLLYHYRLSATVIVTASHNPKAYNGFKILCHKKLKIKEPLLDLKNLLLTSQFKNKPLQSGKTFSLDIYTPYIASVKKEFQLKDIPFVVDGGNGALGPLAKKVFASLNLSPHYLFCKPNGKFPNHHPDPAVEKNLKQLKKKVLETKSLFGVGFDGDGDRLALITQKGEFVPGDVLGVIFLKSFPSLRSKKVVVDVKCSKVLIQAIKRRGGKVILSQSGHLLTRKKMLSSKADLAIEFCGHIFFNDRKDRGFDDALYACLRLIEILQDTSLKSLLPKTSSVKTQEIRLILPSEKVTAALQKARKYLKNRKETFHSLDGISLQRKSSWALLRSSQTQNALSLRFEASSRKELVQIQKEFSQVMGVPFPLG